MPYWRLFYHVVWATKNRASLIDEGVEETIRRSIRDQCEQPSVRLFAVGMMPDHVHVVLSIPPRMAVADLVGRLKGGSSHAVNAAGQSRIEPFAWQHEYGVHSFGEKALPNVIAYVENQRTRHAEKTISRGLERDTDLGS